MSRYAPEIASFSARGTAVSIRLAATLALLPLAGSGAAPPTVAVADAASRWINDGPMRCTFDGEAVARPCVQFREVVKGRLPTGGSWTEYRWIWKADRAATVHYQSRLGTIGVSSFTIGTLADAGSHLPNGTSRNAVSYAPDRERLIIGVPGDGYEFSVEPVT